MHNQMRQNSQKKKHTMKYIPKKANNKNFLNKNNRRYEENSRKTTRNTRIQNRMIICITIAIIFENANRYPTMLGAYKLSRHKRIRKCITKTMNGDYHFVQLLAIHYVAEI